MLMVKTGVSDRQHASLLKAMELDENEDEEDEIVVTMTQDEEGTIQLPEEWIYDLALNRKGSLEESSKTYSMVLDQGKFSTSEEGGTNSKANAVPSEEEELISFTQPNTEDIERQKADGYLKKGRKVSKKHKWGLVVPLRRSSRNVDDGRTMMDKAQEAKRKWNLEDRTGNKSSRVSKSTLLSVAKDIGLDVGDGNPDLLDTMIELDSSGTTANEVNCKNQGCVGPNTSAVSDSVIVISSDDQTQSPNQVKDGDPIPQ